MNSKCERMSSKLIQLNKRLLCIFSYLWPFCSITKTSCIDFLPILSPENSYNFLIFPFLIFLVFFIISSLSIQSCHSFSNTFCLWTAINQSKVVNGYSMNRNKDKKTKCCQHTHFKVNIIFMSKLIELCSKSCGSVVNMHEPLFINYTQKDGYYTWLLICYTTKLCIILLSLWKHA